MVCSLIDFAVAVPELLMFQVCEIIGISKIVFFNFSGNERVKVNRVQVNINVYVRCFAIIIVQENT